MNMREVDGISIITEVSGPVEKIQLTGHNVVMEEKVADQVIEDPLEGAQDKDASVDVEARMEAKETVKREQDLPQKRESDEGKKTGLAGSAPQGSSPEGWLSPTTSQGSSFEKRESEEASLDENEMYPPEEDVIELKTESV